MRVPADAVLGGEGNAFAVAQTRLGGGRIHHAMRTIAQCQKALDMLRERALSRRTAASLVSEKQFVQGYIADSYAQLTQFRLLVLYTAWETDCQAGAARLPAVRRPVAVRAPAQEAGRRPREVRRVPRRGWELSEHDVR